MFSVRVVTTDHYLAEPIRGLDVCYSEFRGTEVKRVPVFRLYGSTPAAQKTCMHVHGVFPYLYVPYDGTQPLERFTRQFAGSIDKALNVALGRSASTTQHVYKITLVAGRPMYGYHEDEQRFLKIYLYNPQMVRKVADLLLGGAVMNKVFQPHESHIPYKLQLFMDYNLYGMNMINVAAVKFRKAALEGGAEASRGSQGSQQSWGSPATPSPLPMLRESLCRTPSTHRWDMENIPSDMLLDQSIDRQSTCELEVDVVAADILNRLEVGANVGTNPGLVALWEDEKQRRREHGLSDDLTPQESQDRGDLAWTPAEAELQQRLRDILTDLQQYIEASPAPSSPGTPDSMPALESSLEVPSTPASLVEQHVSLQEEDVASTSSQGTVILEEEEEPVVNETSILRVVSSSQSFYEDRPPSLQGSQGAANSQSSQQQQILDTQDKSLAEMLASLASGEDSPTASQAASQITALEESDSVLGAGTLAVAGATAVANQTAEDDETVEMSQRVDEDSDENTSPPRHDNLDDLDFDLAGMDQSWNSSQWVEVNVEDEQTVPQYDGPADEKAVTEDKTRRRYGTRGAIIQHNTVASTAARNEAFSVTVQTQAGRGPNLDFRSLEKPQPLNARITVSHVHSKAQLPKSATSNGSRSVVLDLRDAVPMQPHNSEHYRSLSRWHDKGFTNSVRDLTMDRENKTYARRKEKGLIGGRVRANEKVTDNTKVLERPVVTIKDRTLHTGKDTGVKSLSAGPNQRENIFEKMANMQKESYVAPVEPEAADTPDLQEKVSPSSRRENVVVTNNFTNRLKTITAGTKDSKAHSSNTSVIPGPARIKNINSANCEGAEQIETDMAESDQNRVSPAVELFEDIEKIQLVTLEVDGDTSTAYNTPWLLTEDARDTMDTTKESTGQSDSEDSKSGSSVVSGVKPGIVKRRRSSDSSSTDDLTVGEHRFTYEGRIQRKNIEQVFDKAVLGHGKPVSNGDGAECPKPQVQRVDNNNPSDSEDEEEKVLIKRNMQGDNIMDNLKEIEELCKSRDSDHLSDQEQEQELQVDPDSTSLSENEFVMDLTGCDDLPDLIDWGSVPKAPRGRPRKHEKGPKKTPKSQRKSGGNRSPGISVGSQDDSGTTKVNKSPKVKPTKITVEAESVDQSPQPSDEDRRHSKVKSPTHMSETYSKKVQLQKTSKKNNAEDIRDFETKELDQSLPDLTSMPNPALRGAELPENQQQVPKKPSPTRGKDIVPKGTLADRKARLSLQKQRLSKQKESSIDSVDAKGVSSPTDSQPRSPDWRDTLHSPLSPVSQPVTDQAGQIPSGVESVSTAPVPSIPLSPVAAESGVVTELPVKPALSSEKVPHHEKNARKKRGRPPAIHLSPVAVESPVCAEKSPVKQPLGTEKIQENVKHARKKKGSPPPIPLSPILVESPVSAEFQMKQPPPSGKITHRKKRGRPRKNSLSEETVLLNASFKIRYYKGRSTKCPEFKTRCMEEACTNVRIRQKDCLEYDLAQIGQEKLELYHMSGRDIQAARNMLINFARNTRIFAKQFEGTASPRNNEPEPCKKLDNSQTSSICTSMKLFDGPPPESGPKPERPVETQPADDSVDKTSANVAIVSKVNEEPIVEVIKDIEQCEVSAELQATKDVGPSKASVAVQTAVQEVEKVTYDDVVIIEDDEPSKKGSSSEVPVSAKTTEIKVATPSNKPCDSKIKPASDIKAGADDSSYSKTPDAKAKVPTVSKIDSTDESSKATDKAKSQGTTRSETPMSERQDNARQQGTSRGPSRRSSFDGQQYKGGPSLSEVDFSVLENPMDTGTEMIVGTDQDPHLQLHTPPLVMDPNYSEAEEEARKLEEMESGSVELISEQSESQYSTTTSPSEVSSLPSSPEKVLHQPIPMTESAEGTLELVVAQVEGTTAAKRTISEPMPMQESSDAGPSEEDVCTQQPSSSRKLGRPPKRHRHHRRGSKNTQATVSLSSDGEDSGKDGSKRQRRVYEQSDHYRFRSKRVAVDYSPAAFAHIYKMESTRPVSVSSTNEPKKGTKEVVEPIKIRLDKSTKGSATIISEPPTEKKGPRPFYIRPFKGHKSMEVKLQRMNCGEPTGQLKQFFDSGGYVYWNLEKAYYGKGGPDLSCSDSLSTDDSGLESEQPGSSGRKGKSQGRRNSGESKPKPKKSRSLHARMSGAFTKPKSRRRKPEPSDRLMNTLSLLHQATLANLTDTSTSYSDNVDDDVAVPYVDVMSKLALFSPPASERGDHSPPVPSSPGEITIEEREQPQNESETSLVHTVYDTPQSSVETHKSASKSPDGPIANHPETESTSKEQSRKEPPSVPYAVKTSVVRFGGHNKPGPSNIFSSSCSMGTSKDASYLPDLPLIAPPDLGPPVRRPASPRSTCSGSSGSPPMLFAQCDRSPKPQDLDVTASDRDSDGKAVGDTSRSPRSLKPSDSRDREMPSLVEVSAEAEKPPPEPHIPAKKASRKSSRDGSESPRSKRRSPKMSLLKSDKKRAKAAAEQQQHSGDTQSTSGGSSHQDATHAQEDSKTGKGKSSTSEQSGQDTGRQLCQQAHSGVPLSAGRPNPATPRGRGNANESSEDEMVPRKKHERMTVPIQSPDHEGFQDDILMVPESQNVEKGESQAVKRQSISPIQSPEHSSQVAEFTPREIVQVMVVSSDEEELHAVSRHSVSPIRSPDMNTDKPSQEKPNEESSQVVSTSQAQESSSKGQDAVVDIQDISDDEVLLVESPIQIQSPDEPDAEIQHIPSHPASKRSHPDDDIGSQSGDNCDDARSPAKRARSITPIQSPVAGEAGECMPPKLITVTEGREGSPQRINIDEEEESEEEETYQALEKSGPIQSPDNVATEEEEDKKLEARSIASPDNEMNVDEEERKLEVRSIASPDAETNVGMTDDVKDLEVEEVHVSASSPERKIDEQNTKHESDEEDSEAEEAHSGYKNIMPIQSPEGETHVDLTAAAEQTEPAADSEEEDSDDEDGVRKAASVYSIGSPDPEVGGVEPVILKTIVEDEKSEKDSDDEARGMKHDSPIQSPDMHTEDADDLQESATNTRQRRGRSASPIQSPDHDPQIAEPLDLSGAAGEGLTPIDQNGLDTEDMHNQEIVHVSSPIMSPDGNDEGEHDLDLEDQQKQEPVQISSPIMSPDRNDDMDHGEPRQATLIPIQSPDQGDAQMDNNQPLDLSGHQSDVEMDEPDAQRTGRKSASPIQSPDREPVGQASQRSFNVVEESSEDEDESDEEVYRARSVRTIQSPDRDIVEIDQVESPAEPMATEQGNEDEGAVPCRVAPLEVVEHESDDEETDIHVKMTPAVDVMSPDREDLPELGHTEVKPIASPDGISDRDEDKHESDSDFEEEPMRLPALSIGSPEQGAEEPMRLPAVSIGSPEHESEEAMRLPPVCISSPDWVAEDQIENKKPEGSKKKDDADRDKKGAMHINPIQSPDPHDSYGDTHTEHPSSNQHVHTVSPIQSPDRSDFVYHGHEPSIQSPDRSDYTYQGHEPSIIPLINDSHHAQGDPRRKRDISPSSSPEHHVEMSEPDSPESASPVQVEEPPESPMQEEPTSSCKVIPLAAVEIEETDKKHIEKCQKKLEVEEPNEPLSGDGTDSRGAAQAPERSSSGGRCEGAGATGSGRAERSVFGSGALDRGGRRTSQDSDHDPRSNTQGQTSIITPAEVPPSREQIQQEMDTYGLPTIRHQDAYCSNPEDLPDKPR